jgi:hypothetical protein
VLFGDNTICDFKLYYGTTAIKTQHINTKNRQEDQWVKTEDPNITPHIYSQLIFNKGAQNTQYRKKQPLQQMLLEKLDIHM